MSMNCADLLITRLSIFNITPFVSLGEITVLKKQTNSYLIYNLVQFWFYILQPKNCRNMKYLGQIMDYISDAL